MIIKENDKFKIELVNTSGDFCEQCNSKEKPIYWLKGKYDNIDTMLCKKCLLNLKEILISAE